MVNSAVTTPSSFSSVLVLLISCCRVVTLRLQISGFPSVLCVVWVKQEQRGVSFFWTGKRKEMASNFPVHYLPCADDMHGEQKTMSPLLPDRRSLSCRFDPDEFVTFHPWWKPTFAGSGFVRAGLSHCSGLRVSLGEERMFLLNTFYSERSLESVKTHSSIQLFIFFHPRLWLHYDWKETKKNPTGLIGWSQKRLGVQGEMGYLCPLWHHTGLLGQTSVLF